MFATGLLELFSFIDQEIVFLVFLSDTFLKSLLIILLLRYLSSSIKVLTPGNKHLMWLSGFLCLTLLPFLPALFESVFTGTALGTSLKVMTVTVSTYSGSTQLLGGAQAVDWSHVFLLIYFLILSFLLLRLLASMARVAQLCDSTEYLYSGDAHALLKDLCAQLSINRTVSLGLSESIHSPHSSGLIAPKILLPIAALNWDRSTLESVLIHELTHINRFDWLTMIACYVLASINWFNPLVWYAMKKMKAEAEYDCDSAVLESGKLRTALAEDLLKVARDSRRYHRVELAAQGMIDDEIASRVENILHECNTSRKHSAVFLLGLLLATATILTACGSTSVVAFQMGDVIERSQLLYSEQPRYPLEAVDENVPGWVLLGFTVSEFGRVEPDSIEVEFSQPEGVFDAASISALQNFRFEARKVNDQARQSLGMRYMFRFRQPKELALANLH